MANEVAKDGNEDSRKKLSPMTTTRRLMAVMFSDIVGYTSIMQENEEEAKSVRDTCEDIVGKSVAEHGGSLVQFYGDGVLSVFPSAIQAAHCALEIQKRMSTIPNAALRIGIHVGDVVYDGERVYGDAVNIASRIQGLAAPGGVSFSEKVFDEVKNQPGLEATSIGLHTLKNVKRPIEVFALSSGGLALPRASAAERVRAILVDDEELARKVLKEYLSAHEEVDIVAECSNGFEAVKAITELHPDLMFLDIQMPKLNGFEVLELIENKPVVIFTTAFDEYALKAFEVHAVDYLLKPFSQERLDEALGHAKTMVGKSEPSTLTGLVSAVRADSFPLERVLVRDATKVHIVHVRDIDYLEARDDYVAIKAEGKELLKQMSLSSIQTELDPRKFVRIHRSFILNIERLDRIELYAKDSHIAILHDGTRLQVSRSGYGKLKELL